VIVNKRMEVVTLDWERKIGLLRMGMGRKEGNREGGDRALL